MALFNQAAGFSSEFSARSLGMKDEARATDGAANARADEQNGQRHLRHEVSRETHKYALVLLHL